MFDLFLQTKNILLNWGDNFDCRLIKPQTVQGAIKLYAVGGL